MRAKDPPLFDALSDGLSSFHAEVLPLPGLANDEGRAVLLFQMVDSVRRINYLKSMSRKARSSSLYTPYSGAFNPLAGAAALDKAGRFDDAYWLVFLATHFGKHKEDRWNLTEDFYGRFNDGSGVWDWARASSNPAAIEQWIEEVYPHTTSEGRPRRFGNHRKFETLKPGPKGTGHACQTYIELVLSFGSHSDLIRHAQHEVGQNPKDVFAYLYKRLGAVAKFGRLGKFDLLCNLSNLEIAPILADRPYIAEATGPADGATLLFGGGLSLNELDQACARLAAHLDVSPQVIEDALCNWQKSPEKYIYFRG